MTISSLVIFVLGLALVSWVPLGMVIESVRTTRAQDRMRADSATRLRRAECVARTQILEHELGILGHECDLHCRPVRQPKGEKPNPPGRPGWTTFIQPDGQVSYLRTLGPGETVKEKGPRLTARRVDDYGNYAIHCSDCEYVEISSFGSAKPVEYVLAEPCPKHR